MPLNKPRGSMYKGHYTWNPLSGDCEHKCVYCYVESMKSNHAIRSKYSGEPRVTIKEYKENLYKYGEGITIFVQNMSDLFANNVSHSDIRMVLNCCNKYPENVYLFQTKNPKRFNEFEDGDYPPNRIKATTIETNITYARLSEAPPPIDRYKAMLKTKGRLQITIEPILVFDLTELESWMFNIIPEIIYIGADSKKHDLPEPKEKDIVELYLILKENHKVELKPNLRRLAPSLF